MNSEASSVAIRVLARRRALRGPLPSGCPACAPIPRNATTRYCAHHIAQLKASYQRIANKEA